MPQDSNPYVNEDDYVTEWESIMEDARVDPADGLDDLLDFIERMLVEVTGSALSDRFDPEIGRRLDYAREIVRDIEEGRDIEQGDIEAAVAALTYIFNAARTPAEGGNPGTIEPAAAEQLELESGTVDMGEAEPD
jgi:hypothetical protein